MSYTAEQTAKFLEAVSMLQKYDGVWMFPRHDEICVYLDGEADLPGGVTHLMRKTWRGMGAGFFIGDDGDVEGSYFGFYT